MLNEHDKEMENKIEPPSTGTHQIVPQVRKLHAEDRTARYLAFAACGLLLVLILLLAFNIFPHSPVDSDQLPAGQITEDKLASESVGIDELSSEALAQIQGQQGPPGERGPAGPVGPAGEGIQEITLNEQQVRAGRRTAAQAVATCEQGEVIGGGAEIIISGSDPKVVLSANTPSDDRRSWIARARYIGDENQAEGSWQLLSRAICATIE